VYYIREIILALRTGSRLDLTDEMRICRNSDTVTLVIGLVFCLCVNGYMVYCIDISLNTVQMDVDRTLKVPVAVPTRICLSYGLSVSDLIELSKRGEQYARVKSGTL
jgi:hypothetical protein